MHARTHAPTHARTQTLSIFTLRSRRGDSDFFDVMMGESGAPAPARPFAVNTRANVGLAIRLLLLLLLLLLLVLLLLVVVVVLLASPIPISYPWCLLPCTFLGESNHSRVSSESQLGFVSCSSCFECSLYLWLEIQKAKDRQRGT